MAKIVNTLRPIKAAAMRDSNTIRGHRTDTDSDSRLAGHWGKCQIGGGIMFIANVEQSFKIHFDCFDF